jgi:hypothetical protein
MFHPRIHVDADLRLCVQAQAEEAQAKAKAASAGGAEEEDDFAVTDDEAGGDSDGDSDGNAEAQPSALDARRVQRAAGDHPLQSEFRAKSAAILQKYGMQPTAQSLADLEGASDDDDNEDDDEAASGDEAVSDDEDGDEGSAGGDDGASDEDARHAEADAFFCLMKLMNLSESRDLYCKQLDQSDTGVKQTLSRCACRTTASDFEKDFETSVVPHLKQSSGFYLNFWMQQ